MAQIATYCCDDAKKPERGAGEVWEGDGKSIRLITYCRDAGLRTVLAFFKPSLLDN